jgi:pre-mRNA-splicing factor CWC22
VQPPIEPKNALLPKSAGGVYMPPHKMKAVLEELQKANEASEEKQKYNWELLRKSINGIVNKVSVANISHIVLELFNENLLRGRGLLTKALMKS